MTPEAIRQSLKEYDWAQLHKATFIMVWRSGVATIYKDRRFTSTINEEGGINGRMVQACIALGVPACDETTIPSSVTTSQLRRLPLPVHPGMENEMAPGELAPFPIVFEIYRKLGAAIYNWDK